MRTQLQADEEENKMTDSGVDSMIYGIQKCGCFGQLKQEQCGVRPGTGPRRKTHMLRDIITAFYHGNV